MPQTTLDKAFKALHAPGSPLILTNIYDIISAQAVAAHPSTTALATASYAVAATHGLGDDDLTLELNLASVKGISKVAREHNLPLTVDFQDGYGEELEEGLKSLLDLGVVGINIEDCARGGEMIPMDIAATRIERVLKIAKDYGIEDFVVNARSDALLKSGSVSEVITRGKTYLEAGATTVFVWGGRERGGITRNEVKELSEAFVGRLNVSMRVGGEGNLGIEELRDLGVARISIGPALMMIRISTMKKSLDEIYAKDREV